MKALIISVFLITCAINGSSQTINQKTLLYSDTAGNWITHYYPRKVIETIYTADSDLPEGLTVLLSAFGKVFETLELPPMKKGQTFRKVIQVH